MPVPAALARQLDAQRSGRARMVATQRIGTSREKLRRAPVGGWNTRDSLAAMPKEDAVILDNWFPDVSSVKFRGGSAAHATGVGSGNVETLLRFHEGTNDRLIACGGGGIYNATASGAATALKTGLNNDRWIGVMFKSALHMCSEGADNPQMYDGTTVTEPAWSGVGLTNTDLVGVHGFKERLFLWEANSQDFWYGGSLAITGTLTKFPLSMVGTKGGYLMAIKTWTIDGGSGPDDFFVAFMSTGETIVYQGTDPGDASAWSLVGVYKLPEPLHQRGIIELGGDIMIMTNQDYLSLTETLRKGKVQTKLSKLSGAAVAAAKAYGANFGWQAIHYPQGNRILFNVPVATNGEYHQHVLNTVTGAAARFKGWEARCWCECAKNIYFGVGSGAVYKADSGVDDVGADIAAVAQCAWDDMGLADNKIWNNIRPLVTIAADVNVSVKLGFDFADLALNQTVSYSSIGPVWDVPAWDAVEWGNDNDVKLEWLTAGGHGRAISARFDITTSQAITWDRVDYRFTLGQGL